MTACYACPAIEADAPSRAVSACCHGADSMTTLAAQIIDQQVSGIVERHSDAFAGEQARKPINAEMRLTDTYGDRLFAR